MSSIDIDISKINKKLDELALGMKEHVRDNKRIKMSASKFVIPIIKSKIQSRSGLLAKSIGFINFIRSSGVFIGPNYRIAPHAWLVENGYTHRSGRRVEGLHYLRTSYNETRDQIYINLLKEVKNEFDKIGRNLEI